MKAPDSVELVRHVLDRQVVDSNNVPCGKVDDVELTGGPGEPLRATALLVGPGAYARRLPVLARFIVRFVAGSRVVRVPWSEVSVLTEQVKLESRASELGLDRGESWAAAIVGRLPGSGKS